MVKYSSTRAGKLYRNSEQYSDCSNLLIKEDDPPLEELDPAILSCGLPAIMLSDIQPVFAPLPIRYTIDQLQAIRQSTLSFRRPLAADDPRVSGFAIWRTNSHPNQGNRRGGGGSKNNASNSCSQERHNGHHHNDTSGTSSGGCSNVGVGFSTSDRDKSPERTGRYRNHGRENGFVGPRFRRNNNFSSSNHHVIVKSYRSDSDQYHLQNTVIEEEPEWVTAGPTSRLDTIELRGFDDDLSVSQSSSEKASGDSKNSSKSSGKHISFYDDLHHYEHVHHARKSAGSGGGILKSADSSGSRENDIESVTTSNTGSPPPARSTPTKQMAGEFNNPMMDDAQRHNSDINVNNFEEFMKFDSLLGSDSAPAASAPSGSRFNKWVRRGGNTFNHSFGNNNNYDARRNAYHLGLDGGPGNNARYSADRHHAQQFGNRFASSFSNHGPSDHMQTDSNNTAFNRLVDMMAQNRANNNLIAHQQQYLMQMLNKNQQSESLRRMLIKNTVDNASDANQQQTPRVPTQLELQLHTQSIMQNALLRKKLQDQRKMIIEQNNHMAEMAAVAAASKSKPNAEVQQFVKSVSPNIQRSLSLLAGNDHYRPFNQTFSGGFNHMNAVMNNPTFGGRSHNQDLSDSLRQMLLPQHHQQQQGSRPFGNRRRYEKRSVSWKHPN